MRIWGDGRQHLREHVDGIRFSARVTPLEAGVPGFRNTVGLDRQVGCLCVSLSVYLQGWTKYTQLPRKLLIENSSVLLGAHGVV